MGICHDVRGTIQTRTVSIIEHMQAVGPNFASDLLIKYVQGKIRHWGLSNETPFGVMAFVSLAKELNLPKPVSIQNSYSLLTREFESGLGEVSLS